MITKYKPKTDVKPYYPSVIDIETTPTGDVIGVGFAWCEPNGVRNYERFDGWEQWITFYETLLKQYPKENEWLKRIYAHNGAGFDWLSLLQWALAHNQLDKMSYIFAGGFGIGVNATLRKMSVRLRDSYRLLPASLAKLCKTFDTEHKKINIATLPHVVKENDEPAFWRYLENDVLALQEVIYSFWCMIYDLVGSIGELPMTLPSLASRLWRLTLDESMMTPRHERLKALERRAYTGGRTECFQVGIAPVRVYDANSEYPSVMLTGIYPTSYRGGFTTEYNGTHGIYHIRYRQRDHRYKPVLRDEKTGEFTYEGEGVYVQPEIEAMLSKGGEILEVIEGYVYVDTGNPFQEFISRWWKVRAEATASGNDALAFTVKILMNSLYGKFGQKEEGWILKYLTPDEQIDLMRNKHRIKIVGDFTLVWEHRHSENTFVSVAAYITAQARQWLYAKMCEAQDSGGILWATDTDSIHVEGITVETGTGLGEWKLEFEGNAVYLGKKLYALEDVAVKAKGVGKSAEGLDYDTFVGIAKGEMKSAQMVFGAFPTFREVLLQGKPSAVMIERKRTLRATVSS